MRAGIIIMHTQIAGCGLYNGLAAPVLCSPAIARRSAKRAVTAQRVNASADESAPIQASLQSRAIGLGLGLALSFGIAAAPAIAAPDAVQVQCPPHISHERFHVTFQCRARMPSAGLFTCTSQVQS